MPFKLINNKKQSKLKSQAWFGDFFISILVFLFVLIFYYAYISNISKQDSNEFSDLTKDSKDISSSLILAGNPSNWNNETVIRIGLTNNDQKLDNSKIRNFALLNYNKSKKILGTTNNFFVFFEDSYGNITNVEGFCGIGDPRINTTLNIKSAYFHSKNGETLLLDFMISVFNADVYIEDEVGIDLPDLINNINTYGIIVLEHPRLSGGEFNSYNDDFENYVSSGGFLLISGMIATPAVNEMLGVEFYKYAGESTTNLNATVVNENEFLSIVSGQNITFAQAYYVVNESIPAENFTEIAKFGIVDVSEPLNNAIARWNYGDGDIFYFSDFDASYFNGNFLGIIEGSTRKWVNAVCNPINVTDFEIKNLVKIERFLIYDSDVIKMVLYTW